MKSATAIRLLHIIFAIVVVWTVVTYVKGDWIAASFYTVVDIVYGGCVWSIHRTNRRQIEIARRWALGRDDDEKET